MLILITAYSVALILFLAGVGCIVGCTREMKKALNEPPEFELRTVRIERPWP